MAKKITGLSPQKKNPRRLNVYLDDEFAFGLSQSTAAWLNIGQEISDEKIAELLEDDQKEIAYQRALNYLNYRARSEAEIQKNLAKHDTDPEIIEATLSRLRRAGLVDDRKFAEDWVTNRSEFKPRGVRGLRYELRLKKINEEIIDEVLEGVDEEALAYLVAKKKADRIKDIDRERFFQKISGLLARRGFNSSVIYPTTNRVWEEQQESTFES
jgi:regulatory protein